MTKFNFSKLLDARHKAHKKRMICIDKCDRTGINKFSNKVDDLSQRIINHINEL